MRVWYIMWHPIVPPAAIFSGFDWRLTSVSRRRDRCFYCFGLAFAKVTLLARRGCLPGEGIKAFFGCYAPDFACKDVFGCEGIKGGKPVVVFIGGI